ncbi:hypothetical protein G5I_07521 [Acromyrmex echinatior]|uniref:Uncharacterized protein n=1 Tax=Acromyrmex echinatior TaxID=103372 RepID=F4WP11_ACREC|nr:hypothetical protein G5I_07521 [Acromyrmex echinatior]
MLNYCMVAFMKLISALARQAHQIIQLDNSTLVRHGDTLKPQLSVGWSSRRNRGGEPESCRSVVSSRVPWHAGSSPSIATRRFQLPASISSNAHTFAHGFSLKVPGSADAISFYRIICLMHFGRSPETLYNNQSSLKEMGILDRCDFRWHLYKHYGLLTIYIIGFTLLRIISGFLMQLPTSRWFAGELRFTGIETRAKCIHKQCLLPSRHNTERHSTSHKIDLDPSERLELP